jgi:3-(3-hydroxy-phenyl)propionate hydroxylase
MGNTLIYEQSFILASTSLKMNECSFIVETERMFDKPPTPRDDRPGASSEANQALMQFDVLVVGYGPVGAAAACLLGGYGVKTLVIDRAADLFMAPRAIALDHEALRILQLAGLSGDAFRTVPIPQVRMVSPYLGLFARMDTSRCKDGHPQLVTFYQPDLERALRARVACQASVTVQLQTTLLEFRETSGGIVATLQQPDGSQREVSARYLVAADGGSSSVRKAIGQEFRGRSYAEDWLVVDAKNVASPIDHVEFLCDHRRPTPHMIAPDGRQRWEFMLRRGETPEQMEQLDTIRRLLAPWGDAAVMQIERQAVYRFHARCCESFQKGRVFLVGDAAHITPPFIGQGLVAGLRDVANLSWKLAWVTRGHAGVRLLATYDTERRPHAKKMIQLATRMGKLVMPPSALQALLTHGALRLLRAVPGLRTRLEQTDIKPANRFRRGLLAKGRARGPLIRGGLLPQASVRDEHGRSMLSDEALGPTLSCVGFGVAPEARVEPATRAAFLARGGRFVQFRAPGAATPAGEHAFEDVTCRFGRRAWIAVVRPDRAVLHDGPARDAERLLRESLALLDAV